MSKRPSLSPMFPALVSLVHAQDRTRRHLKFVTSQPNILSDGVRHARTREVVPISIDNTFVSDAKSGRLSSKSGRIISLTPEDLRNRCFAVFSNWTKNFML